MAAECDIAWTLIGQAAQGARDATCSRSSTLRGRDRDADEVGPQPDEGSGAAGAGGRMNDAPVRIVLRPIANPLPLGFLALAAGTLLVSGLQLDWLAPTQGEDVGLILLAFVFPLQLIACVFGYLGRDVVAGTGMGPARVDHELAAPDLGDHGVHEGDGKASAYRSSPPLELTLCLTVLSLLPRAAREPCIALKAPSDAMSCTSARACGSSWPASSTMSTPSLEQTLRTFLYTGFGRVVIDLRRQVHRLDRAQALPSRARCSTSNHQSLRPACPGGAEARGRPSSPSRTPAATPAGSWHPSPLPMATSSDSSRRATSGKANSPTSMRKCWCNSPRWRRQQ